MAEAQLCDETPRAESPCSPVIGPPRSLGRSTHGRSNCTILALECENYLDYLSEVEKRDRAASWANAGFWASVQLSEYRRWSTQIGVSEHGGGLMEARLENFLQLRSVLEQLLLSLCKDLCELTGQPQEPEAASTTSIGDTRQTLHLERPETTASYASLSSSSDNEADVYDQATRRRLTLRTHVEDTIERLRGHAVGLEQAEANKLEREVDQFLRKPDLLSVKHTNDNSRFWALARQNASTVELQNRIFQSLSRREARLQYLRGARLHDGKSPPTGLQVLRVSVPGLHVQQAETPSGTDGKEKGPASSGPADLRLPPPPDVVDGHFTCFYCGDDRLSADEAEPGRWVHHIMQDVRPYFCTVKRCDAPLDVPTSFEGLIEHLQTHMPVRYHLAMPDGSHKEFENKVDYDKHAGKMPEYKHMTPGAFDTMRASSRRRSVFKLTACPFSGCSPHEIPDEVHDTDTWEHQRQLMAHLQRHMLGIAFFQTNLYRNNATSKALTRQPLRPLQQEQQLWPEPNAWLPPPPEVWHPLRQTYPPAAIPPATASTPVDNASSIVGNASSIVGKNGSAGDESSRGALRPKNWESRVMDWLNDQEKGNRIMLAILLHCSGVPKTISQCRREAEARVIELLEGLGDQEGLRGLGEEPRT
ncbi:hypothetical protein MAPG_06720 [Magnaporthiopsis poae ATCC 64411]|uniref:C2H2-type domain-containing protein n=1 Tax=Magnaporthiopsis poae (strain ATCC 64411 / 73-15) TaxID=644358 RepID=A0A0C4E2T0_MAGP6|nr:hypothetical protein MAPG_06720 [Magnaporthiopsis poae ATCC 64411]